MISNLTVLHFGQLNSTTPGGTESEEEHLGHVITVLCDFGGGGGGGGWVEEEREELDWDNPEILDKLALRDWREEGDEGIELDGDRGGGSEAEGDDGGGWLTGDDGGGLLVGDDGAFIDWEEGVGELGVGDYE